MSGSPRLRYAGTRDVRVRHDGYSYVRRFGTARLHSAGGASGLGLCAGGLHRCAADGRRGAYAAVETDTARIGGADGGGESLCGVRSELRCAAGDAVRVGAAARSLFRGRVDRCGTGSRSGPERTGRGGDDRRHDGGQSLRRAAGNAGQPPVVVAGTVLHRRRLGCGDGFFPLALGTVDGACGRQPRIEGAVRLPAESGAVAHHPGDDVR